MASPHLGRLHYVTHRRSDVNQPIFFFKGGGLVPNLPVLVSALKSLRRTIGQLSKASHLYAKILVSSTSDAMKAQYKCRRSVSIERIRGKIQVEHPQEWIFVNVTAKQLSPLKQIILRSISGVHYRNSQHPVKEQAMDKLGLKLCTSALKQASKSTW